MGAQLSASPEHVPPPPTACTHHPAEQTKGQETALTTCRLTPDSHVLLQSLASCSLASPKGKVAPHELNKGMAAVTEERKEQPKIFKDLGEKKGVALSPGVKRKR